MKKAVALTLILIILVAPMILAPSTDYENDEHEDECDNYDASGNCEDSYYEDNNSGAVEKISLEGEGNVIEWETEGYSEQGFKVVWSKEIGPEYPTRDGDKYHYYTEPERKRDELEAFDGPGAYYVRVCEYLGGKCGIYSNEIMLTLGTKEKEDSYEEKECVNYSSNGECEEYEHKEEYEQEHEYEKEYQNNEEKSNECNNGCLLNEVCYPLGHRINGQFCSNNLTLIPQFEGDATCENNFECDSNVCVSGQCIQQGLIQKILGWLKSFFG